MGLEDIWVSWDKRIYGFHGTRGYMGFMGQEVYMGFMGLEDIWVSWY